MSHVHSIYDTDLHFIIDPISRSITSESGKVSLMQYDHNSERFTFQFPRYIEGHDMSLSDKVEIHYINISSSNKTTKNEDVYEVDDLQVSPDSDDVAICSWLISHNSTNYAGSLSFIVRFVCYSDNEIEYQWFSDIFDKIKILKGIYNTEVIPDKFDVDILECWKRDVIQAFENSEVYAQTLLCREEAVTSAENAAESEVNAKTSEINAKESEINAAESEVNAKTSEVNAKESEVNAQNSAMEAAHYANTAIDAEQYAITATEAAAKAEMHANDAAESAANAKASEKIVTDFADALSSDISGDPEGEYDPTKVYDILDIVSHGNKLWVCKMPSTCGVEPTKENNTYWQLAVELIPITEEEIDVLDSVYPATMVSEPITNDEIDNIVKE